MPGQRRCATRCSRPWQGPPDETGAPLTVCIPLPEGTGFCTACRADVEIDGRGRCACGLLAIYRSDRPRPEFVTETLVAARDTSRDGVAPRTKRGYEYPVRATFRRR